MPFIELHNAAKHMIHLTEAIEAGLLAVESTASCIKPDDTPETDPDGASDGCRQAVATSNLLRQQLRDRLHYRKSLFRSTKLRLGSLQKRIDNCINLAFNTVTQYQSILAGQDSKVMLRDSSTMKAIAAVTLLFLPATA